MSTAAFRDEVRATQIAPSYRGALHAFSTLTGCGLGIAAALAQLEAVRPIELVAVPCGLVVANVVEYLAHRFLMHAPRGPLAFLYRRHTLLHHRFFTAEAPTIDTHRDMKAVLFPAPVIAFFLVGIALPLGVGLSFVASHNAAALFAGTAVAYYGLYEALHLTWHLPERHALARLAPVRVLRSLHRLHHDDMTRGFNVTFPLTDLLFGTVPRAGRGPPTVVGRSD